MYEAYRPRGTFKLNRFDDNTARGGALQHISDIPITQAIALL